MYDTLPEKEDEEDDMLDLAFELTDTWVFSVAVTSLLLTCPVVHVSDFNQTNRSRLGCQICVREDMDGMKVRIPDDGF
jgi:ferredoxin